MVGLKVVFPYYFSAKKDPGILKQADPVENPKYDFLDLLEKFDSEDLCPDC